MVLLVIWTAWSNTTVGITHYTVASDRLPASFDHYSIVVVSDLHNAEFGENNSQLRQHRTIAEASAVESPIRQETIGFPAHFFARAHNFKPPGRACQPEADSPMRT